jgi:hypothetical protein
MKNTASKSASSSTAVPLQVLCTKYKTLKKGSLQGFAVLEFPGVGLRCHECGHFRKDNKEWVNWPSRSYEQNGEKKYFRLVESISTEDHYKLQDAALAAIELYLGIHGAQSGDDNEAPF